MCYGFAARFETVALPRRRGCLFDLYFHAGQDPELLSKSKALFLQLLLQMGFHLGLGLYCLFAGNLLFDLLSREKPGDGDSDSTRPTTLGL